MNQSVPQISEVGKWPFGQRRDDATLISLAVALRISYLPPPRDITMEDLCGLAVPVT